MIRRQPRSTLTDTIFPYTTLFLSLQVQYKAHDVRPVLPNPDRRDIGIVGFDLGHQLLDRLIHRDAMDVHHKAIGILEHEMVGLRSEERRVGKECVSTCRSGWSPYH